MSHPARVALALFCSVWLSSSARTQGAAPQVTSPVEFLGQPVGADHFLADYTQLLRYWRKLATESDRMVLEEIGTTSYGQTMVMAVISAPENLAARERYRRLAAVMCQARVDESQARELAREGKAIVWIDGGLHATESVAAQNILELVWRMVSRDDAEVRRILENVILLVCPANPDGMEMVARGYMASKRVGRLPVLYQRYVGHDNNRDFYMANVAETAAINRVLYRQWYPQIVYNHHQTAPRGTVIFTPPFRDPFNYNIDPMVVRGIALVAAHMNARFAAEGKPGVISRGGASYSTWWNGGLRTTAYFHNMIGILTESFGSPNPSRIEQRLERRLPSSDYPMPIASQTWHARQTIEYLQTANFAILDLASRYREELLYNIWRMGRNGIARGSRDHWTPTPKLLVEAREREALANAAPPAQAESAAGEGEGWPASAPPPPAFEDPALRDPRAWVLPADQADFAAATRLVRALQRCGVEVHRATGAFTAAGARCPAGSWVVQAAQAFRSHAFDMLEPQWHPDDTTSSGDPVRPYDSAGWTPALTMGVEVVRVRDALEGPFERVTEDIADLPGTVSSGTAGYLLNLRDSNAHAAINRLLAARETLHALAESLERGAVRYPAGSVFVQQGAVTADRAAELAAELGVDFAGLDAAPPLRTEPLRPLRIGLFDVYGGNMATGWTEWVLRQDGYPVELVFGARIHEGDLRRDFDVLLFHTGLPAASRAQSTRQALRGGRDRAVRAEERRAIAAAMPPFEDWSTVEARAERLTTDQAIPALRAFAEAGGTLLAFGSQATSLARHFVLPVREGVQVDDAETGPRRARRSEFFVPASVLAARVAQGHPLALGVPAALPVVYRRSPAFVVEPGGEQIDVVVEYADEGLLSGWAVGVERLAGKAAVLSAPLGAGRVHLFGADVIFRGQPVASFKLVFNALLQAASMQQR